MKDESVVGQLPQPLGGGAALGRMQAEALDVGARYLLRRCLQSAPRLDHRLGERG
jgi:hypothetical protein